MKSKLELGLYLHIPFCVRKCEYCDFLSGVASEVQREEYVQALLREIKSYRALAKEYVVTSIFLGGGTPSVLEGEQTARIMGALQDVFAIQENAEITTEANPGTVGKEKLNLYRQAGINRISFGLQSTQEEELHALGRIHSYHDFLESYESARNVGFTNINVDLMSAIPKQTLQTWEKTLDSICKIAPEHISAYSLIVEEGTPFYEKEQKRELFLPEEETERLMYEHTYVILKEHGYQQYEISNYAKPGCECRHNIAYWTRKEYLGLGLGAASLMKQVRFAVTKNQKEYLSLSAQPDQIHREIEKLDRQAQIEEFMFLGLRMLVGVNKKVFYQQFGQTVKDVYGKVITKYQTEGLLCEDETRIYLTRRGIGLSNLVMSEFLL